MSSYYRWNPMPDLLAVVCPQCGDEARFEFAEAKLLGRKTDLDYFKQSKVFEYELEVTASGRRLPLAFYYHGLSPSLSNVSDLPDGYTVQDWDHNPHSSRWHGRDIGGVVCTTCDCRRKHQLDWPRDAFFQIEHKGQVLWAFSRETVQVLVDYIASTDRNTSEGEWPSFLRHVPSHFLGRSERDAVLKKLRRLL